jgi:hypothetical protein
VPRIILIFFLFQFFLSFLQISFLSPCAILHFVSLNPSLHHSELTHVHSLDYRSSSVQLIAPNPTGDDIVIGDQKVALPYKEWLADLGVSRCQSHWSMSRQNHLGKEARWSEARSATANWLR